MEIIGVRPEIDGTKYERFFLQEFSFNGEIIEEASVLYFESIKSWHSLSIDGGVIFWKSGITLPTELFHTSGECEYRLNDITNLIADTGIHIHGIEERQLGNLVEVVFKFSNNNYLILRNSDDNSTYEIGRKT
jgi:hypothetical protein